MEDFEESEGKIVRTPGKFKFRVMGEKNARTKLPLTAMESVMIEEIEWLWSPYIPLGRLTILGGDPGAGKSFISTAIASALSTGSPLPGEVDVTREPMVTLMLNAEDDPGDTIKPRLNNMCADQTKIFVSTVDIILDEDGLNAVEEMVLATGAKLVTIDPIVAFLGPKVDMNRANEIRHIMKGLARIARRRNIAIVIVRHNRKQAAGAPAGSAIYNGMGSIDFTASVRSELAVVETRHGVKFLNHIKANSGKKGLSIRYDIVSLPDGSGQLKWGELVSSMTLTNPVTGQISKVYRNEQVMKTWLFDILKEGKDGVLVKDIIARGQLQGYSQTKLEHVKKGVAVSVKRIDGWYWKLDPKAKGPLEPDEDGVVE